MNFASRHLRWLRPERSVLVFACTSGCFLVGLFTYELVIHWRYCVSAAQIAQLQPGMTHQQVLGLLGPPRFRTPDDTRWYYDAPFEAIDIPYLRSAEYRLHFSADGGLTSTYIHD